MRALDNLIANEYDDTNGEALRNLDIIEVQDKILKMRDRDEDLENLLYNIEDWVDDIIDNAMTLILNAAHDEIEGLDDLILDDIIDDMSDQLKNNIAKKVLEMMK